MQLTTETSARPEVASGANWTAAQFGPFAKLDRYELAVPGLNRAVKGKVFIKEPLGLTGMEVSLNKFPAGAAVPFNHKHREHEELYLFLRGKGEMQVDGQVIAVTEGSAVRVAPDGARSLRNVGPDELQYLCIQVRASSMTDAETITDGVRVEGKPVWPS